LSFSIFHRILWLFLCANALIVYLVSGSIRSAVVTTMVGSLSLQLAYLEAYFFWSGGLPAPGELFKGPSNCMEWTGLGTLVQRALTGALMGIRALTVEGARCYPFHEMPLAAGPR